jgi:uncharacterized repeat protein (TIGR01451 family)
MATVLHPRFPRAFLAATVVTTLLALMAPLADRAQGETVTPSCPVVPVALSNDSFESPVVEARERRIIDGSAVTGWIGSGTNGKVTLLASGWTDINAAVGRQFAQLSGSPARLSQDVASVPGTSLAWSLSHRAVNGSASMRVLIGSPGSAGKEQAVVTDSTTWTRHGGTYKVPDGQTITRITLLPADGSAPDANLVDEVSFGTAACIVAQVSLTPSTPIAVEGIVTQSAVLRNTGGTPTKDVVLGVGPSTTAAYVEGSANPSGIYGLTPDTLLIRPVGALGVPGVILPTESVVVTWQERILPEASNSVITIPSTVTVIDAFDTKSVTPEENTTVVVRPSSDIQVSQKFTPSLVASGGSTTLSFTARNDGPSDASGVTVTEELPAGAALAGALPDDCALSARTVTCTVGSLANGDSRTWEIALIAPTTSASLVARSSLQVRSNGTDPSGDNNRSVEALSIAPPSTPTLEANLSPSPVIATAGSVATVSVDVMNISTAAGSAPLTVTGSFPEGFTPLFVVGTPSAGASAPACTSEPALCTFASMAAGASARVEFRGVIDSRLADGTSFLGSVQTAGIGAPTLTTPVVFSVNAQSTLAIDERIAGPMSAGSPITKLVTVVNSGPSMALESTVFVPLPDEATPIDTPTNCTEAFGGLGCTLGTIDSGAFASTAISFELPATGGTIRDGARAATTTPMPNPVVDRYSRTEFVGPVSDLFVKVTGIDPATDVGDAVSFMIDVTNRGPGEATAVQVLTDPKLTGLRFDSALPERGEWNANIALWEIPTLAPGATARLRIEATGTRTSASSLSVFARSSNPDIAAIDNTAIAPLDVLASVSPDTKSSRGWLMPVLLGIGVLIFIAACVYLFLQWRKNKP